MTMPPDGAGSPDSWMTINDVFHIAGRGTVVVGLGRITDHIRNLCLVEENILE